MFAHLSSIFIFKTALSRAVEQYILGFFYCFKFQEVDFVIWREYFLRIGLFFFSLKLMLGKYN